MRVAKMMPTRTVKIPSIYTSLDAGRCDKQGRGVCNDTHDKQPLPASEATDPSHVQAIGLVPSPDGRLDVTALTCHTRPVRLQPEQACCQ